VLGDKLPCEEMPC